MKKFHSAIASWWRCLSLPTWRTKVFDQDNEIENLIFQVENPDPFQLDLKEIVSRMPIEAEILQN